MGCDIHAFIEYHDEPEDQWYTYKNLDIPRNYFLFYKLAGVRGSEGKHFPVKGLPDNLSHTAQIYYENRKIDFHTPSWLDLYELCYLKAWMCYQEWYSYYDYEINTFGYIFGYTVLNYKSLHRYLPDNIRVHDRVDTYRMTFWFDN